MSDESVCEKPRCPKCGSEARGRGRVHIVEEDRYEEGMFFECGTMVKGDGEISQTVNDCQLNELTRQLTAANAEIERLREALDQDRLFAPIPGNGNDYY